MRGKIKMANYTRLDVLNMMIQTGLVPLFYHKNTETGKKIIDACAAGGARLIEFTNRGDFAIQVFSQLAPYCAEKHPGLVLGVGSIVDAPTAALFIAHGANFVVGPTLVPEIARLCNRRKIAYLPGCGSLNEISQAEELGAEIVKIFPGNSVGGPDFIKTVLGPCPWSRLLPTGGVDATPESVGAWIKVGAACVGMGSNLLAKDHILEEKWEAISEGVANVLQWVREARGEPVFQGIEHMGLYPKGEVTSQQMVEWYSGKFGFKFSEGNSSFFLFGSGNGRLEICKEPITDRVHVAVRVSNFEKAVHMLQDCGIEIEEMKIKSSVKSVFLKEPDPAGNLVHLFWSQ
jgi:2-dehydro-3-deoxyphosphogluconate aldolase/(4S)-4-hydroxy-2-oxoglutarate aldolase